MISRRLSRRFQAALVAEAALVGLIGGASITLYRLSLGLAEKALRIVASYLSAITWGPLLWIPIAGLLLVILGSLMR